jgi:hypothetical protein
MNTPSQRPWRFWVALRQIAAFFGLWLLIAIAAHMIVELVSGKPHPAIANVLIVVAALPLWRRVVRE